MCSWCHHTTWRPFIHHIGQQTITDIACWMHVYINVEFIICKALHFTGLAWSQKDEKKNRSKLWNRRTGNLRKTGGYVANFLPLVSIFVSFLHKFYHHQVSPWTEYYTLGLRTIRRITIAQIWQNRNPRVFDWNKQISWQVVRILHLFNGTFHNISVHQSIIGVAGHIRTWCPPFVLLFFFNAKSRGWTGSVGNACGVSVSASRFYIVEFSTIYLARCLQKKHSTTNNCFLAWDVAAESLPRPEILISMRAPDWFRLTSVVCEVTKMFLSSSFLCGSTDGTERKMWN